VSGYNKYSKAVSLPVESGYFGVHDEARRVRKETFFGKTMDVFSSTHERSHILCAYGMSHFSEREPCYVLVWEGRIGSFYEVDENIVIRPLGRVMEDPGRRYTFIFALAEPSIASARGRMKCSDAGKLMALTSFSKRRPYTTTERILADTVLQEKNIFELEKRNFVDHELYNVGVESEIFKNFSGNFSDSIFDIFYNFAKKNLKKKFPLLISGGCGLNCDWNTKWKGCGLFSDVFVPPVPNDSGIAIGTAIDALLYYEKKAKIKWNVYSGKNFIEEDIASQVGSVPLDYEQVAQFLVHNKVIGWVQGRAEIGPRALGNRSILASPFNKNMQERLNRIKQREQYRPIAPICIEEEFARYFEGNISSSPHMLYFQMLKTSQLSAITHVDNTARAQTVTYDQNKYIHTLLLEFKKITGFGILCNTSLNFSGMGFINRSSDLLVYGREHGLDGFVINDRFYILNE
jgi:hydroxymethyl cephem carbamoyltransferase